MVVTLTSKGQVTIPKKIREALHLDPGDGVEFTVSGANELVLRKVGAKPVARRDRFDSARGKAQIKWRTNKLMVLLRG